MSIAENILHVRDRIAAAAIRAKRNPAEISLMAVTKTVAPQQIREAYEAGIRLFGENRVQEFAAKSEQLLSLRGVEWHMIGHLQSNKAAKAAELFGFVDSIDSIHLARKLNAAASQLGRKLPVLIEVNVGGDAAKNGVEPDSAQLQQLLNSAPEFTSLEFRGLMTVPPYHDNPQHSRPYFRQMRGLFEQTAGRKLANVQMSVLSMGMSHDFEIAIEEGASCVRLGTAIFGKRPKR
jgi:pyridoxal phosphate enzyme (YggS family)